MFPRSATGLGQSCRIFQLYGNHAQVKCNFKLSRLRILYDICKLTFIKKRKLVLKDQVASEHVTVGPINNLSDFLELPPLHLRSSELHRIASKLEERLNIQSSVEI